MNYTPNTPNHTAQNNPAAVLRVGLNGVVVNANAQFWNLSDRHPESVIGMRFQSLFDTGAITPAFDWSSKAPDHRTVVEVPLIRGDGTQHFVDVVVTAKRSRLRRTAEWLVTLSDVDEQRQSRLKLEASEQLHCFLAENSHDMVVRISISGVRLYVSPACEALLGYTQEEMIGETPIAAIHPEDRARVANVVQTLLEGAGDPTATYRQCHKAGHWVWLEAVYRLIRDSNTGEPTEFIASVRDVSRRMNAEEGLANSAMRLQEANRLLTMAEGLARVGHWRLDLVHDSIFWSDEVYAIHGVSRDTTLALALAVNFYHPDDRERVGALVDDTATTGTPFSFQARILRPNGEIRWVQSTGQAELAPNNEIVGLMGVFQDITERVENERRLIAARQVAEEALLAKSVFTATLTHEIRTPLTGVLAAAELLTTACTPLDQSRYLEALTKSGKLLSSIIDDVLVFSKLDNGGVAFEALEMDLVATIRDVIDAFQTDAAAKAVTLRFVEPKQVVSVIGDPTRIQRIVANLLSNAIKFSNEGLINVRLDAEDGQVDAWRISVSDMGVGIPRDRLASIFQPYVQADASITRKHGGTGLGLAISRHLVEAMGGRIWAANQKGGGSVFSFVLALPRAAEPPPTIPSPVTLANDPLDCLDVLIAEDNPTNRYLIVKLLQRLGQNVTAVEDGAEAVAAVKARQGQPFDLILMDIQMPVMDGIAASAAIRALSEPAASTSICAITAEDSTERRQWMNDAGINEVLSKPIKLHALRQILQTTGSEKRATIQEAGLGVHSVAAIDAMLVRSLEETLGRVGRDELLGMLIGDAERRPAKIRAFVANGQPDQASLEAHSFKGAALIFGADALVGACQTVVDAARTEALGEELIVAVEHEAQRVILEARALLLID